MSATEVQQVVQVFSSVMEFCPLCRESGAEGDKAPYDEGYLAARVNHLLAEHGCVLLHVGTQTDTDGNGDPWQMTTAVVGVAPS